LFDTHCHFNLDEFKSELDSVIERSIKLGVDRFLVPGIDKSTSENSLALETLYSDQIYSAVGIHPGYSSQADPDEIEELLKTEHTRVSAIGEIGLDYFRDYSPRTKQLATLKSMFSLAIQYQLPIILHNRKADDDLIKKLDAWYVSSAEYNGQGGIFHAFDGSEKILCWGMDHHFLFGIGGMVTYKKNDVLREKIRRIGLEHLVLETDSPYLTPVPQRGKRNSPENLHYVVDAIADILAIDKDIVIKKTHENAMRIFGLL